MNQDESIRFAARYLEDLLSFFGINVAVNSTIDDEVIQLSVPSTSLNSLLIGRIICGRYNILCRWLWWQKKLR